MLTNRKWVWGDLDRFCWCLPFSACNRERQREWKTPSVSKGRIQHCTISSDLYIFTVYKRCCRRRRRRRWLFHYLPLNEWMNEWLYVVNEFMLWTVAYTDVIHVNNVLVRSLPECVLLEIACILNWYAYERGALFRYGNCCISKHLLSFIVKCAKWHIIYCCCCCWSMALLLPTRFVHLMRFTHESESERQWKMNSINGFVECGHNKRMCCDTCHLRTYKLHVVHICIIRSLVDFCTCESYTHTAAIVSYCVSSAPKWDMVSGYKMVMDCIDSGRQNFQWTLFTQNNNNNIQMFMVIIEWHFGITRWVSARSNH